MVIQIHSFTVVQILLPVSFAYKFGITSKYFKEKNKDKLTSLAGAELFLQFLAELNLFKLE